ncbi:MAG: 6-carboxytetrahydropterin synthase QueD [Planctomycetota bacterium]
MFRISVEHSFAAAHCLRIEGHKCESLHGHNWIVTVTVQGKNLDQYGMLMDFHDLKAIVAPIVERLDHVFLNSVPPFDSINPTTEQICRYISDEVARRLPEGVSVYSVKTSESQRCCGEYLPGE